MKLRVILGLFFGAVAPLAYWLGLWLGIAPVTTYVRWFRSAHLPDPVMWRIIPWGCVHLAIILYDNRVYRRFSGPVMFLIVITGSVIVNLSIAQTAGGPWGRDITIIDIMRITRVSILHDAIPAATATLLGMCLAGRCNSPAPAEDKKFEDAVATVHRRFGNTMKKLAE